MADKKRAEFPDYAHPLYTPDEAAQAEVAERIKRAMHTGPRKTQTEQEAKVEIKPNGQRVVHLGTSAWDGSILYNHTRYKRTPMGERPRLTQTDVAKAWGVSQKTVSVRINNPQTLNHVDVFILCHALGVTLDWLRGWTDENAYGRYEDNPQVVAKLYERLTPRDKEFFTRLLMTLIGEDAEREVYEAQYDAYMNEWAARHADEVREINAVADEARRRITDYYNSMWHDVLASIGGSMGRTVAGVADRLSHLSGTINAAANTSRAAFDARHYDGAYDRAMCMGKILEDRGENMDEWDLPKLLEFADSVEHLPPVVSEL